VAILKNRCASCHSGAASKGSFPIFGPEGSLLEMSRANRSLISTLADTAQMPPAARGDTKSPAALSDDEVQALKRWAASR
jgi:mono/diheme cytochrome c family protein